MKKRNGLIVLGLIAGWGASRLLGSRGHGVREKAKVRVEQLKGRVEQVVGKATGSEETQPRFRSYEATYMAPEKDAEIRDNARAALEESTAT